jgi:DNA polymerase III epsilon subunit family exonuclease
MAMIDANGEANSPRYEYLSRRALDFLSEHNGRATEDDVVRHVFGSGASSKLWSPLLRSVLAAEPKLTLLADGHWVIEGFAAQIPTSNALGDFTALDVETTGLRPLTHRIIEVAAIRYREGREIERFVTFLQPERKLPSMIINLTGIRDADLEDAPLFRDVADDLLAFLGDDLIVGHNVGFDISFIAGELKRLGRPGLANNRFDTLSAANRLLTGIRRKNLGKLADFLGVPRGHDHRAYDDARKTAEVALRLVDAALQKGITDPVEIRKLGAPMPRPSKDGNPRRRPVLDRSLLQDIPKTPGVYIMSDGYGHVIYVGKAKNLRDRVSSYFSQALGYTRKMDGLLESLVSIRVEETGTELQALLLEAQLIRFYQPRYNTALRASENYPYIRINVSNAWPRITLTKERKDDGAVYFGPYRSRSTAQRAVDIMNSALPLRTCPRSFKDARSYGRPCIKLDLKQCLGPCTGQADRSLYRHYVRTALSFLEGDGEALATELQQEIELSVDRLDFERARRIRNDLQTVRLVAEAQRSMVYATVHHNLILVLESARPGCRELLLVLQGRLWAQIVAEPDETPRDLAVRLARSFNRFASRRHDHIDHASLDDALILNRWIRKQSGHPAILPIDIDHPVIDWHVLAERALTLTDGELAQSLQEPDAEDRLLATDSSGLDRGHSGLADIDSQDTLTGEISFEPA